ncbi:Site-specific DNA-cytosine methylase (plasmid) [Nostoc flagelliforme CCNUN1]|uniref:Site-specific DNA-cytosine methylase n=1 Tax=Nostoc flagelliforme CCNUN1 TaxID=2038116 RepID=A0A2K8TBY1_9NOSO|nr:Site-specific DNA-cytosine methylase [Nostoc flagelliforme CCNUN1]
MPDGTVKSLSIEGAAILQGFPGWYEFPNEAATAGSTPSGNSKFKIINSKLKTISACSETRH